jgi:hypothetical protein
VQLALQQTEPFRQPHLGYRKLRVLCRDLFHLSFTPSAGPGFDGQIRRRGAPLYEQTRQRLPAAPLAHAFTPPAGQLPHMFAAAGITEDAPARRPARNNMAPTADDIHLQRPRHARTLA